MSVRLTLPQTLKKGKVAALTFVYDGKLTGDEESPVFGIKFAAIHPEASYLLYPSRWFPVNDYSTDRFSSELKITVPDGYTVLSSGNDTKETAAAGFAAFRFKYHPVVVSGQLRGGAGPGAGGHRGRHKNLFLSAHGQRCGAGIWRGDCQGAFVFH